jgi:PiT family inorganic phosphate transporter
MSLILLVALGFAFIVGTNDGAALLAANLTGKAIRPLPGLLALVVALVVVPMLVGTSVADTLATGLVAFDAAEGPRALLVAVSVTIGLIYISSRLGLPTSVTQALTGAMIGAGIGAGLHVDLEAFGRVVLSLALVPLVAGIASLLVTAALVRLRVRGDLPEYLRRLHIGSYLISTIAYAANDGQKMLAVLAIALGTSPTALGPANLAALAACFAAGAIFGLRRLAARFGRLLPGRPLNAIVAGYAAGLSVLASALVGAPVSMSHATTAGLIGSATVIETYRRVRWEQVVRIGMTWLTTMPAATFIAAVVAATVR